jgi:hypothetical protein
MTTTTGGMTTITMRMKENSRCGVRTIIGGTVLIGIEDIRTKLGVGKGKEVIGAELSRKCI